METCENCPNLYTNVIGYFCKPTGDFISCPKLEILNTCPFSIELNDEYDIEI